VACLIAALVLVNRTRTSLAERSFWGVLFVSIALSAAVVMKDDGWRVLHVTHTLVACFFAMGFAAPATLVTAPAARALHWRTGAGAIALLVVLFIFVPWLSHVLTARSIARHPAIVADAGYHIVPGGRFISGFQVIADGEQRPLRVPTLHMSDLLELTRVT